MALGKSSDKRSIQNVLINRPLQREFTLIMLGIMMMAAFSVGMMINFTLRGLTDNAPITVSRTTLERMILDANSQLVVSSVLIIFLAVIATGFFGVFFLHRVAGPVYRFRKVLKQMGSGQVPETDVHLRRRDFFKETADELNRVIHLLREFEETSETINLLLRQIPKEALPSDASTKLHQIQDSLSRLKKVSD